MESKEENSNSQLVFKINTDHNIFLKKELRKFTELGLFTNMVVNSEYDNERFNIHSLVLSAFFEQVQDAADSIKPILHFSKDGKILKGLVDLLYLGTFSTNHFCSAGLKSTIEELKAYNVSLNVREEVDDKSVVLSVPGHNDILMDHIWESRFDLETCDLIFVTNDFMMSYAHSPVIAACSQRFQQMYKRRLNQGKPFIVVLQSINYSELEYLIKFCYIGAITVPEDMLARISQIAQMLGITQFFNISSLIKNVQEEPAAEPVSKVLPQNTSELALDLIKNDDSGNCYIWKEDMCIPVHNIIIKTYCPFLKKIYDIVNHKSEDVILLINTLSFVELRAFVDFMYTGEASVIVDSEGISPELVEWLGVKLNINDSGDSPEIKRDPLSIQNPTITKTQWDGVTLSLQMKTKVKDPVRNDSRKICFNLDDSEKDLINQSKEYDFSCRYCSMKFKLHRQYKAHLRKHTLPNIFKCDTCGKVFLKKCNLTRHEILHAPPMHQCEVCGKRYANKDYLAEHSRSHSGDKPYECTLCFKRFTGRTGLNHHAKLHSKNKAALFVCEVCGKEFSRQGLWGHMKTHNKEYLCTVCERFFATPSALKRHIKWVHEKHPALKCEFCPSEFEFKSQLDRHMVNEHRYLNGEFISRKAYACDKCSQSFHTPFRLQNHVKTKHETKEMIPCTVCGKLLSGNSAVKYHMRTHTGERPHSCLYCPKTFTRPDLLKKHTRIHTGERFVCTECNKSFTSKHYLTEHSWTHSVKCEAIPVTKEETEYLKSEYTLLEEVTLHQCSLCAMTFLTEELLKHHLEKKSCLIVSSYVCQHCDLALETSEELAIHLQYCQPVLALVS